MASLGDICHPNTMAGVSGKASAPLATSRLQNQKQDSCVQDLTERTTFCSPCEIKTDILTRVLYWVGLLNSAKSLSFPTSDGL